MTDAEQGFLDAIIAEPDDDDLRLIYADWLEEKGNVERADSIRIAIHLEERIETHYNFVPFSTDEKGVFQCHFWNSDMPFDSVLWSRGFIEKITCTAEDWLKHADTITREHPVQYVKLTTWPVYQNPFDGVIGYEQVSAATLAGMTWRYLTPPGPSMDRRAYYVGRLLRLEWPHIEFELPS